MKQSNLNRVVSTCHSAGRSTPEKGIIVKHGFCIDGTKHKSIPIFELLLLADASGFEFLARYFAERAKTAKKLSRFRMLEHGSDPDDHAHLQTWSRWGDFNTQLSDSMEIRVGTITKGNRREVLKKYGISAKNRRSGSMTPNLIALATEAERYVKREDASMRSFAAAQQRTKKQHGRRRK